VRTDFAASDNRQPQQLHLHPLVEPIFTLDASHGGEGIVDVRLRMI
jgi:hypothetical protein